MHRDSLISFIRFIQGFHIVQAKLRCSELCLAPWEPAVMCSFAVKIQTWPPPSLQGLHMVSRAGNQTPGTSGGKWNKQVEGDGSCKYYTAAKSMLGVSAAAPWPPLLKCLGLWVIIKGQPPETLFISTIWKKKKTYVKWALYMLFTHLAGAPSEAEIDCLHCLLTLLAPLKAAAA